MSMCSIALACVVCVCLKYKSCVCRAPVCIYIKYVSVVSCLWLCFAVRLHLANPAVSSGVSPMRDATERLIGSDSEDVTNEYSVPDPVL